MILGGKGGGGGVRHDNSAFIPYKLGSPMALGSSTTASPIPNSPKRMHQENKQQCSMTGCCQADIVTRQWTLSLAEAASMAAVAIGAKAEIVCGKLENIGPEL